METDTWFNRYHFLFRKHWLPLTLFLIGLIFFGYGLISLFPQKSASEDIVFEKADAAEAVSYIIVDVAGAVVRPGVYKLKSTARLHDSLIAAGGLAQEADREWVGRSVNLAAKLTDGAKVYIPSLGEGVLTEQGNAAGGTNSLQRQAILGNGTTSQININSASLASLDTLSGIGVVTGQKIIDNRPYGSIEELLTKKIVSKSVFERIKEKISVY